MARNGSLQTALRSGAISYRKYRSIMSDKLVDYLNSLQTEADGIRYLDRCWMRSASVRTRPVDWRWRDAKVKTA